MKPLTLTIFSGLPGTGKTTIAQLAAAQLQLPLVRLDDVVDIIPAHMAAHADPFWEDMMQIVLGIAEMHLNQRMSVIIDAVFMGDDRAQARQLARRYGARFCPIHTYVSDEHVWRARVEERRAKAPPTEQPAAWEQIVIQRTAFQRWEPGSALMIDGIRPIEHNLAQVLGALTSAEPPSQV